ncbi:MAG: MarR family winged helix-turn-helix transcriptional regulator [Candidatus Bipolaricaulota bacterium]|nr:MarR family winged helix-turn-helix transcriptional regulator [Candidatus Bipolaricaulota bacterium]
MTKKELHRDKYGTSKARVGRIQDLVCQLGRLLEGYDEMCLASLDITVSQGYTIMALPQDGDVGMSALGEALGVAPSTATRMVDQLVSKRLVERRSAPKDRRAVRIALTEKGQRLRQELGKATASCFLGALDGISASRQMATIEALELVNASLGEFLETGSCTACKGGSPAGGAPNGGTP